MSSLSYQFSNYFVYERIFGMEVHFFCVKVYLLLLLMDND